MHLHVLDVLVTVGPVLVSLMASQEYTAIARATRTLLSRRIWSDWAIHAIRPDTDVILSRPTVCAVEGEFFPLLRNHANLVHSERHFDRCEAGTRVMLLAGIDSRRFQPCHHGSIENNIRSLHRVRCGNVDSDGSLART
jgi:hypothetical protein